MEHFVTLFDSYFLPQGLSLYASLSKQNTPFCLWVICMDQAVESSLEKLSLPYLKLIPLSAVENLYPELRETKADRSKAEYCWTLTPFTFSTVFQLDASVSRVTYVDADVYLFGSPLSLLQELDHAKKSALITDHAYAPNLHQESTAGKFCVQFLTICKTSVGLEIMKWWQDRCIEWCYARYEDGKFGDQKYLEAWPILWPDDVHVLNNHSLTLAPWNVEYLLPPGSQPIGIYHFHGLRLFSKKIRLWSEYRLSRSTKPRIYNAYTSELQSAINLLSKNGLEVQLPPPPSRIPKSKADLLRLYRRTECWSSF